MADDALEKIGENRWLVKKRCRITGFTDAIGPVVVVADPNVELEEGSIIVVTTRRISVTKPLKADPENYATITVSRRESPSGSDPK